MKGIRRMLEVYEKLEALEQEIMGAGLTCEEAKCWVAHMKNEDGTEGAHWTMVQTTDVAERVDVVFEHIRDYEWWAAMNMVYSDYSGVANKYGVSTGEFYADLAKAFLFDKDGGKPEHKLAAYYHGIAAG